MLELRFYISVFKKMSGFLSLSLCETVLSNTVLQSSASRALPKLSVDEVAASDNLSIDVSFLARV